MEHEDAAAVYLCVRIEQNDSCLQEGLIDHVFEALEFDVDTVNKKAASSETKALVKVYMEKLHMMTEASVCFTIILCTNILMPIFLACVAKRKFLTLIVSRVGLAT